MSKFSIKEKIDGLIYYAYNIFSDCIFLTLKFKDRKLIRKNVKFKDIHKNKRCFILGTGPSLKNVNPKYLEGEITFGVNHLYKSELLKYIIPTYYCLVDNKFSNEHSNITKKLVKEMKETTFFLRTETYTTFNTSTHAPVNVNYLYSKLYPVGKYKKNDIAKNSKATFNVVPECIKIAMYMGFTEIYLLGCDFNSFASINVEHCYDNENQKIISKRSRTLGEELKEYSIVSSIHYSLKEYADANNISIINLTTNSLLDAYEKKNIEDVIIN